MSERGGGEVLAFLTGAIVGGIAALLLAPAKGSETRAKIGQIAGDAYTKGEQIVGDAYTKGEQIVESGRSGAEKIIGKGREKLESLAQKCADKAAQ
jgi:gas vesicle protein